MEMTQKEHIIEQYAKKIYGFSYQKAGNTWDAEELSQEIILVLCQDSLWNREIKNMDAYIYRICKYTWSNFVRSNIQHWRSLDNDRLYTAASEAAPEQDVIQQEQFQQLRQEILYLSALRRKILIAFYYDQKTGDEIARELAIPSLTVRRHLRQAKETIKERINMTESTLYQPVRLLVEHYGTVHKLYQKDYLQEPAELRSSGFAPLYGRSDFSEQFPGIIPMDFLPYLWRENQNQGQ
jgi:RNA polymerase sigma factor (sigma-70 family)